MVGEVLEVNLSKELLIKVIKGKILLFIVLGYIPKFMAQSEKLESLSFLWSNDTLGGIPFEKTGIFIPIKLANDTTIYYFQLDTGSDRSYFYQPIFNHIDRSFLFPTEELIMTNIGEIEFIQSQTNNFYKLEEHLVIGTIGADIFKNRCVEFDFSNQKINLLTALDSSDYLLLPIHNSFGRPVLTVELYEQNYQFLFDTGSSIFDIWTTKKRWKQWRQGDSIITYPISSWGKTNFMYQASLNHSVVLKDSTMLIFQSVWCNANRIFTKSFRSLKIDGIIGNKPFLDEIIVIDMKSNLFGIKKRP